MCEVVEGGGGGGGRVCSEIESAILSWNFRNTPSYSYYSNPMRCAIGASLNNNKSL